MPILSFDKINNSLEKYTSSRININPIFSYKIETDLMPNGWHISVIQIETNFRLNIKMESFCDQPIIGSFNFLNSDDLGEDSFPLFHAATVDLILIGVDLMFYMGKSLQEQKIKLILKKEETEYLLLFQYFFDYISQENNLFYLSMPLNKKAYQFFLEKYEEFKIAIGQKLWKMQKYDALLKQYLQNPTKSNLMKYFGDTQKSLKENIAINNVIKFPKSSSMSS